MALLMAWTSTPITRSSSSVQMACCGIVDSSDAARLQQHARLASTCSTSSRMLRGAGSNG
jgi:hypothetical protein